MSIEAPCPLVLTIGQPGQFKGNRAEALALRLQLLQELQRDGDVRIDFTGVEATQAFVDELLGVLVAQQGPQVMKRLVFKGCSMTVRAVINFVVADRARAFNQTTPV